ncbi:MAG TPA: DUF3604 domain-containing protein [Thermoguttaceae bacterium]|nr:DUF3604 domain-containing protein [Thermoguttaceae bacterium]
MTRPGPNRRTFLKTMGASAAGLSATGSAAAGERLRSTPTTPAPEIHWRERQDGQRSFFLDPLEGERPLADEPLFGRCLAPLARGVGEYRFAAGRTELAPAHPLVAGCCYDFTWTYFPEEQELPTGAVVAFSIPRTWTQPRTDSPAAAGFVSISRSGGGPCRVQLTHNGNMTWWVVVTVVEKPEPADGWIRVDYGRASIQRFPQNWFGNWRNSMRTAVDTAGNGEYAFVRAAKTNKPVIRSAPPARFHVAAPAVARPGETIEIRAAAVDYCDNPAWPPPEGEVFAAAADDPFTPIASAVVSPENGGPVKLQVQVPEGVDHFSIIVSNRKDMLRGETAATVLDAGGDTLKVYFGDIHAKTMLSDGLNTPTEFFEHSRDVALIDFAAIADHNHAEASRLEGPFRMQMADETYAQIQKACEAFNEPGRFVTIQGFEQNWIQEYPGHRNVYFRDVCPGLFRGKTLDELYAYLEGHKALVVPHHHLIWGCRPHLGNPEYERIIEMYSMHCSSEVRGTPINDGATTASKRESGISAREILDKGPRVGFIAASDNHHGAPGLSARPSRFTNIPYQGGLAAVLVPELSREAVFDAMYERRCYATTGARIYLDFRLDGRLMGSELKVTRGTAIPYDITVSGTDRIAKIELIRTSREGTVRTHDGKCFVRVCGELPFHESSWTYVRVTQTDRQMAWSSPIWVDVT